MNRQQDLFTDLPRGTQLAALRRLKLDSWTVGNAVVSGVIQKSVIRVIDDHDGGRGCWTTQQNIAAEIGCSRASVGRAIAALIDRDLITSERPNHWSPNHHRINWTALHQIDASTTTCATSIAHGEVSDSYVCDIEELSSSGPLPQHESRNAPLIANLNAPTNRPAEWAEVAAAMFRWGLKTAAQACDAARAGGWSIEYVDELFREAGGGRDPERWEPGQLSNWLTGKTPPPFDHDEALRRRDERRHSIDRRDQSEAEALRRSVVQTGRSEGLAAWVTAGVTLRKLTAAGLERFATDVEREGGAQMVEIDRQRATEPSELPQNRPALDRLPTGTESPPLRVDSHDRLGPRSTSEPGNPVNASGVNLKLRSVPGTGVYQRRREIDRALLATE